MCMVAHREQNLMLLTSSCYLHCPQGDPREKVHGATWRWVTNASIIEYSWCLKTVVELITDNLGVGSRRRGSKFSRLGRGNGRK